jgi:ubiquinone/menaquinone biosynthesis C-methylase UbiE
VSRTVVAETAGDTEALTGYFSRRAAHAVTPGGHVVGIDPSPRMIDYAARRAPEACSFQLASAQVLP